MVTIEKKKPAVHGGLLLMDVFLSQGYRMK
jgi:hypothetical protein